MSAEQGITDRTLKEMLSHETMKSLWTNLGNGAATYYHKQVWAQMGDQCAGEWYTDYLDQHNLWGEYLRYEQFLQDEPLTNGRYADIGSDTGAITVANTTGAARAWGKLDAAAGRGLLWIDNAAPHGSAWPMD